MMSQEELIEQLHKKRGVWFTKHDFNVSVNKQTLGRNIRKLANSSLVESKMVRLRLKNNNFYNLLAVRIV